MQEVGGSIPPGSTSLTSLALHPLGARPAPFDRSRLPLLQSYHTRPSRDFQGMHFA